ncbi:MAG: hypothetical protein FWC10_08970, partial [Lentimicrobiaceae bacterium]|nr:hypothetical protein [Lentimicrobiaceae bacterium]
MKKHYIFTNFLSRLLLSAFCFLPFYMWAQNPYVITGSDTQFTATNNGSTIATNKPIQEVIDAIKLNALGADCTIQFGTGVSTINTGTANITFDGGAIGKDWGLVTLTGKLTSACSGYNKGPVYLTNGVSINSQADITGAASGDFAVTFFTNSTGTLTISGGTVLLNATYGMAVYNASTGTVNICGGIVEG